MIPENNSPADKLIYTGISFFIPRRLIPGELNLGRVIGQIFSVQVNNKNELLVIHEWLVKFIPGQSVKLIPGFPAGIPPAAGPPVLGPRPGLSLKIKTRE